MDILTMAKYPYLSETVQYIREQGPDLKDLNKARIYQGVRLRGKERVLEAINNSSIEERPLVTESEALQEILSYIVARILVSSVNIHFLTRRYALSEASLMNGRLQGEQPDFIFTVSKELGITAHQEDSKRALIMLSVSDYLKHSSGFRDDAWKLVNQDLKDGMVTLEKGKFIRLLQHAMQIKIEGELPLPVSGEILKSYSSEINELKALVGSMRRKYEVKDFGRLRKDRLPPCMKQILAMAQAGENLPHSARFAITAFLHTIGLQPEEILKVFGSSPDFDPSIARYQVEHISGTQSGTEYLPPSCAKMKSYGICYNPDRLCAKNWMSHPLKYYRIKGRDGEKSTSSKSEKTKKQKSKKQ
jgi:DNA primase large subunit